MLSRRTILSMAGAESEVIDNTSKLARRLGMTYGELSGLALAGNLAGVSMDTIGKAATSMRSASRATRQQADVAHAEESLTVLEEKRRELENEIDAELERIRLESAPERIPLEAVVIPARKTDTAVEEVVLAWVPRGPRG